MIDSIKHIDVILKSNLSEDGSINYKLTVDDIDWIAEAKLALEQPKVKYCKEGCRWLGKSDTGWDNYCQCCHHFVNPNKFFCAFWQEKEE